MRITKGVYALLISIGACGGSGGVGDAGASGAGGGSTSSASLDGLIQLSCERTRTCCGQEGFDTAVLADCEAQGAGLSNLVEAIERGTTRLLEPAYGNCLAQWRAAGSVCELGESRFQTCEPIFSGNIAPGGACEDAIDCASNGEPVVCLRADDRPREEPGVCRALRRGAMGDPCLLSVSEYTYGSTYSTFEPEAALTLTYCGEDEGLYCSFSEDECVPYLVAGSPCVETDRCARELYCDPLELICKPTKSAGRACTDSAECGLPALLCKEGVCSTVTYADTGICEGDFD